LENPSPLDFKGFGVAPADRNKVVPFTYEGKQYQLTHGDVVIAAITSCTNTSNPNVMIGAGLLAKNAVETGLTVNPYIKTSLAPGYLALSLSHRIYQVESKRFSALILINFDSF
jgi:aconitate hydratase